MYIGGSALIATISRKTGISKDLISMVGDFVGYNDLYTMFTGKDGVLRDYNTDEMLNLKPGQPRNGKVDFGHVGGKTYKDTFTAYKNRKISLKQLKEFQFNPKNFRLELPSNNRSHRYE